MTENVSKSTIIIGASGMNETESFYKVKSPTRGGYRPNAGRPKGSSNKIRLEDLMDSIEEAVGQPFEKQIALNYANAIFRNDWAKVADYDKVLLNKIVADKTEVEVITSEDEVTAKAEAFAEALKALTAPKDIR
jgi:hypothetical protein